jgi:hypothetical protein
MKGRRPTFLEPRGARSAARLTGSAVFEGMSGLRVKILARKRQLLARVRRIGRAAKVRYRLFRRKFRAAQKRAALRALMRLLKARYQVHEQGRNALTFGGRWIATAAGLLLAGLFAITLPDALLTSATLEVSEVHLHLASAGIIGTALALVLSLSIVPAQKAADVFSSAILKLYARDQTTLWVFALLSCATLVSLLLGTGWTFSLSARYTLAGQFVLLGASLDALRAFYSRTLNLLDPATALSLVSIECSRYIRRTRDGIERLVRINRLASGDDANSAAFRYGCYGRSSLSKALNAWTTQLEEFAHKGIARRDTQAVNAIVRTMAEIGKNYAEARRDSMLLLPDFSGGIPIGVSDINQVLDPIYGNIHAICENAAKQPNEADEEEDHQQQINFLQSSALWLRATFSKSSAPSRHPLREQIRRLRRDQRMARSRLLLVLILFLLLVPSLVSMALSLLR